MEMSAYCSYRLWPALLILILPALSSSAGAQESALRLPFAADSRYSVLQSFDGPYGHSEATEFAVDFQMPIGTPIVAARGGTVVAVVEAHGNAEPRKPEPGKENYVVIDHGDGTFGRYYHLDELGVDVDLGVEVEVGAALGRSGNSGASFGPHLHFDVTEGCYEWGCQTIHFRFSGVADDPLVAGESYGGADQEAPVGVADGP